MGPVFMKNIIFCFVIFLLILVRSNVFAQSFDFRAVVVDEENNLFVKNVVVQLVNTEYSILNFSRSAEDGSFIFKNLNVDTDYLLITNHLNYQSDTIPIAGEKSMTIFLKQRINALPEVIVREERQSYQNLGDTTVFDVASFEDGFERSVEEIIAKLPGVKVDESGQITFRGKTVSNVLIDYDDLFGKKYGRGTKSLNPKYITELEFIDRYEEEDLIRGVSNSDKLILNLKLADEFKIAVFGDALLGLGIASRYIGKANVFSFTEKSKGLILGGADNVAYQNLGSALENEAMGGAFDDFHFNRRLSRRSGFNFYGKPGLPTELQSLNVNKSVTGSLLNKGSRLKSDLKLSLFSVRNQFDQFESVNLLGEEENVFTNSFSDIVQNLGGEIFHGLVFNTSATSKIKIHSELSLKDFQTSSLRTTASNEGSLPTLYFTPAKVFRQAHHLEYLHQNKDLSVFHFQYTFLNQSVEEDSFHQFLRSVQASENTLGLQPFTQDLFQSGIDHAAELRWLKSFNPATKGKVSAGFRALQDRSTAQVAIQQSPEQIDREFQSDFSRQIFEKYLASTLVRDINKKSSFAMSLEMSTAELESKNELLLDFASKFQYQASSSTAFFLSTSYFRKPIDAWDISGLSYL
ncbi:TonB-dependent receptor [Nitritalea halalkaliphila LW7]|uniref:TonB-dependent receptor n=2 Tax=Nitritalea TaxID=1187887 RepID=I5C875_9BACT|nr:TonB-dependent receptor [Nitritalea halalkaliphila LW7]